MGSAEPTTARFWLLSLALAPGPALFLGLAHAGPTSLDARGAGRALVLAVEAELAGDGAGAKAAIEALLASPPNPGETVGHRLLIDWLNAHGRRAPGLAPGASREAVLEAWDSLAPFPMHVSWRVWQRLVERRPSLASAPLAVSLEIDRVEGLERADAQRRLADALLRRGVVLRPGAPRLGVDLESVDSGFFGRAGVSVTLSAVLSSTVSSFRFHRVRRDRQAESERARGFALRRVANELGDGLARVAARAAIAAHW